MSIMQSVIVVPAAVSVLVTGLGTCALRLGGERRRWERGIGVLGRLSGRRATMGRS